jgi:hypothetical protein
MGNHFTTSDGERVSSKEIDKRIHKAKAELLQNQLDSYGYNFCEECKIDAEHGIRVPTDMAHQILDCSHTKPVSECKKDGEVELSWDVNNLRVLCRFHHNKHDNSGLRFNNKK